jgi:RimJ/RimL family protein N-acetyltransferase
MTTSLPHLRTKRLSLRPIDSGDAADLFQYRSQRQYHPYQGWIPEKPEDAVQYIQKMPSSFNQPDTWFQLAMERTGRSGLIGDLGIHFIDEKSGHCELGISLAVKYRGKGYATEALTAVIGNLHSDFNKNLITVSIDPRNQPSLRLFDRLGFLRATEYKQVHPMHPEYPNDLVLGLRLERAEARRPGKG